MEGAVMEDVAGMEGAGMDGGAGIEGADDEAPTEAERLARAAATRS
jgi:hypothetical protein